MQQAKYPRFESTMWGDIPITTVEHQSLILQPIAPDTNNTIVLEVQNLAGVTTLSVDGDGDLICKTITTGDSQTRTGLRNAVVGGSGNTCSVVDSFVTGVSNTISAGSQNSILGGGANTITGATFNCSILGGTGNNITSPNSNNSVIAGWDNNITGTGNTACSILGGVSNLISNTTLYSAIVSGDDNELDNCGNCVIAGGLHNYIAANYGTISGGSYNTISNDYGSIGGGTLNSTTQFYTTVPGGTGAIASNWGEKAWGGGGYFNYAGDSQISEFTLRNVTTGAASKIVYLNYPSNTQEIALGDYAYGVADLTVVCHKTGVNDCTYYRNSFHYTTGPTSATDSMGVSSGLETHHGATMSAVPSVSVISNNILRITVHVSTGASVKILAHVRLTNLLR